MKKSFLLLLCLVCTALLAGCSVLDKFSASDFLATSATESATEPTAENTATPYDATADADATPAADGDADATDANADISIAQTNNALAIACSTKGFNPYLTTDTLVEQSASLLFENFTEISPDFTLEYRLAQEILCDGTTVAITLRSGCLFADGTPITTQDALQSLLTAMQSSTYAARFANVLDATATDTQIIITLATPDSMFGYLLDIPILKEEDVASTTPTASGRYTYSADGSYLTTNIFAPFPCEDVATIQLVAVSSYDNMMSALALGQTNYTVQSESSTSASGITTTEHYYKTNTLLFLGVNASADNPLCNTAAGRSLLSDLLSRDALATEVYDARAYIARGAINSFYPAAKDTQSILSTSDTTALAQTMQDLGYAYDETLQMYQNEKGEAASVSILIYSASSYKILLASEIAQEWAKYGIETQLITCTDFNSFLTLLESGEFELYIGEMKLYNNMELSSFWSGNASYGIAASEALLNAYAEFRADSTQAAAFETIFAEEMPYIPLLWKNGIVLTSRFASGVDASISDPFYDLGELTFSD